jgi:DNA-binding XRE family transcriptional regulator
MPKSKHRSTVRTLRKVLELNQAEFAELVGISFHLIHSIELRRARLTWTTARKIAAATGVAVNWLVGGTPVHPIRAGTGEPWTLEHFRKNQAAPFEIPASEDFLRHIQEDCMEMIRIGGAGVRSGHLAELRYEFNQFRKRMRRTYGLEGASLHRRQLNASHGGIIAGKLAQMESADKCANLQDADDSLAAWPEGFEKDRFRE